MFSIPIQKICTIEQVFKPYLLNSNEYHEKSSLFVCNHLLKPENKDKLEHILGYHTYVGSLKTDYMVGGNEYDMVFGGKVKITKQGDKTFVNGSEVLASIQTSNGWIHIIGDVLLPK